MRVPASELVEAVLSLVPDAAVVVDDGGTITNANAALLALFGYDEGDLLGRPIETLVPERFRPEHRADRARYSKAPGTRAMGAGLSLFGRRRDGTEFPVDISLAPLDTGVDRAIVAAVRDVSDRRDAGVERALLASIVESSGDAVFAMAIDGTVQTWNSGAEATLGYPSDAVVGRHVSRLYPDDASIDFEEQLSSATRGEHGGTRDSEWLTADARHLPVAVRVSPLRSAGGDAVGFSVVVRDITERKQAERDLRRLLAEGDHNARWKSAMAEIRLRVLDGVPLPGVLEVLVDHLSELIGGKGAAAVIDRLPRVVVSTGVDIDLVEQADLAAVRAIADRPSLKPAEAFDRKLAEALGGEYVLVVPVGARDDPRGYLLCGMTASLDDTAMSVAMGLAEQAALAVEIDRAKGDRERLLIGDERERIARDLHDLVIQRLFASGLSVQSVLPLVHDPRAAERLSSVVDGLDETIREIRGTIFTLAPPPHAATGLRLKLIGLLGEASTTLGFEPSARFEGPVDSAVGPADVAHATAVVREALSNVARHAHATSVVVEVTVANGWFSIVVVDDGLGIGAQRRESGLRNLRSRAEERGGSFVIEAPDGGGTRLCWQVPIAS